MKAYSSISKAWRRASHALALFTIRHEERWLALVGLIVFTLLNSLTIAKHFQPFTQLASDYHAVFVNKLQVSGFDSFTYLVVSDWGMAFDVYRHPLLPFFLYPLYLLNRMLMMLTGMNCAVFLIGLLSVTCSLYSLLFIHRILKEIVGLPSRESLLLSSFFFSMGYVMLSTMVPDHFILSLMMLLLTLYVCGLRIKQHRPLGGVATVGLFMVTAGITLNNGLKTFLGALFTNGRRFFQPRFLIGCVVAPALLTWMCAVGENKIWIEPGEQAAAMVAKAKNDSIIQSVREQYADTAHTKEAAEIDRGVERIIRERIHAKYVHDHQQPWNRHKGKPMGKGHFAAWTDVSTPRWESVVENLFGEGIQLHQDYLLRDVMTERPVIVHYRSPLPYCIEAVIVILFLGGIVAGRKSRWLWLALSFFSFDLLLHVGLGFGLNEVYIMSAHWMYVIPISIGYLLTALRGKLRKATGWLVLALTVYLAVRNIGLIVSYMV